MNRTFLCGCALTTLGLISCSSSDGSTVTDAATAADSATTSDTAASDAATETATSTDAGDVKSCVTLGDTCSEFHGVPSGDVATICSSAEVKSAPCPRLHAVGGCRKEYTVGYYITWMYNDGTGLATEASVRSFCAEEMPPGTFVAP